jgi:hypothetical protein
MAPPELFFCFLGHCGFSAKKNGEVHDDLSIEILVCAAERQAGQRQSP